MQNKLKDAHIDLESLGIKSWAVRSDDKGHYIEFTTSDVSEKKVGETITVIRCRFDYPPTAEAEKLPVYYSVWKGTVGTGNRTVNNQTYTYNVISTSSVQWTGGDDRNPNTVKQKIDIEEIKKIYNENCGDAEKLN